MDSAVMTLRMVLNTLDGMSVTGRDNADRYLGSIQGIEAVIQMLQDIPAKDNVNKEEANGG